MMINRENYEIYFIDFLEGNLSEEERAAVELFLLENPDLAAEIDGDLPTLTPTGTNQRVDFSSLKASEKWNESAATDLLIEKLEAEIDGEDLNSESSRRLNQITSSFPLEMEKLQALINNCIADQKKEFPDIALLKLNLWQIPTGEKHGLLLAALENDLSEEETSVFNGFMVSNDSFKKEFEILKKTRLKAENITLSARFKNSLKRKEAILIPLWAKRLTAVAAVLLAFYLPTNLFNSEEGATASKFSPRDDMPKQNFDSTSTEDELSYEQLAEELNSSSKKAIDNSAKNEKTQADADNLNSTPQISTVPDVSIFNDLQAVAENAVSPIPIRSEAQLNLNKYNTGNALVFSNKLPRPDAVIYDFNEDVITEAENGYLAQASEPLTPLQLAKTKLAERFNKAENETLGVAMINDVAKAMTSGTEDLMAYDKSENDSGFKFKLGRLKIESTK